MTVPNGHFWKTGNSAIAEGVGKHLSAQEIDDLNAKLDAATNYPAWQGLKSTPFHLHRSLGNIDRQEKILCELVERPNPEGKKDLAALDNLSFVMGDKGDYAGSEKLAREAYSLILGHPSLGKNSPQALGSRRTLIKALANQGKTAEAKELIDEVEATIDGLAGGKFERYRKEEKQALDEVVVGMQK